MTLFIFRVRTGESAFVGATRRRAMQDDYLFENWYIKAF